VDYAGDNNCNNSWITQMRITGSQRTLVCCVGSVLPFGAPTRLRIKEIVCALQRTKKPVGLHLSVLTIKFNKNNNNIKCLDYT